MRECSPHDCNGATVRHRPPCAPIAKERAGAAAATKLGNRADHCADQHGERALFLVAPENDPMTEPKQPHDALFKKTFSVPEHAAAEFRAVLPAKLVARMDFSTLTLCSGSYVDEALSGSESDLLFSVQISGRPALLYALFEHQSTPDKLMPLRLLGYIVRILMRHVSDAKTSSRTSSGGRSG